MPLRPQKPKPRSQTLKGLQPRCAAKAWNEGKKLGRRSRLGNTAGPHMRGLDNQRTRPRNEGSRPQAGGKGQPKAIEGRPRSHSVQGKGPLRLQARGRSQSQGRALVPFRMPKGLAQLSPAENFGPSRAFHCHPPQTMATEEAVVANLEQCLRRVGILRLSTFRHTRFAQQYGWLLSESLISQVYDAAGGFAELLQKYPERFTVRDTCWVEPTGAPFETQNPAKPPCPFFSTYGHCRSGVKCKDRHDMADFSPPKDASPNRKAGGKRSRSSGRGSTQQAKKQRGEGGQQRRGRSQTRK